MIDDQAQQNIMEAYERTVLNEGSPILKLWSAPKELKAMYKNLADMRRTLEALDNEVGGTSMIRDINRHHDKLMPALHSFTGTLESALAEYKKMKK